MSFLVERVGGFSEVVQAEKMGLGSTTLYFLNGDEVVKTFNNHGGWLAVSEVTD